MVRRSKDWNQGLAEDLRDPVFARDFLVAAIAEGISLQEALAKVIRAMGVKEFAAQIKMAEPNLQRALHPRHHPTTETLNRLLEPFGLTLRLELIGTQSGRDAA